MRILLISAVLVLSCAVIASAAPVTINVTMTGAKEPGGGDPGGIGNGSYTFDPDADTISWLLNYSGLQGSSLTGFHIHGPNATETANFAVYRGFTITPGQTPPAGTLTGTLTVADDATLGSKIDTILADPHGFYVNLHTNIFPGGAIRSQLPEPATLTLLACGAMGLMIRRRKI